MNSGFQTLVFEAIIHAQQAQVAQIHTANGIAHIWRGDRWDSTQDGIKGHDFQYWSDPMRFDANGDIERLSWVDQWSVEIAR